VYASSKHKEKNEIQHLILNLSFIAELFYYALCPVRKFSRIRLLEKRCHAKSNLSESVWCELNGAIPF